jgi:hypothetical protein
MEVFGMESCIDEKVILVMQNTGFRKVGPHPVFDRLSDWGEGEYENPFDFVDECRHAEKNRGGEAYQRCLLAQWAEWQALMAHCLAP